jgi:hypothetical protein
MMQSFKRLTIGLAALLLLTIGYSAKAVTLADLINNNGTIVSGDKTFSNFSYILNPGTNSGLPDASAVTVTPITLNGNYGLNFSGAWNNPTLNTTTDAKIGFIVTAPGPIIVDDELFGNPDLTGTMSSPNQGFMSITETAINASNVTVSHLTIEDAYLNGQNTLISDAHGYFPLNPTYKLTVTKDMQFYNGGLTPTLSSVDQTFSQVPEPGALTMLIASGICGSLVFLRRRSLA